MDTGPHVLVHDDLDPVVELDAQLANKRKHFRGHYRG